MKNKVSIRVKQEVIYWYDVEFPDRSKGMNLALEQFKNAAVLNPMTDIFRDQEFSSLFLPQLWKGIWENSLVSLKGVFFKPELLFLIELSEFSIPRHDQYGTDSLYLRIRNALILTPPAGVKEAEILTKIESLTDLDRFCLELWAVGFWTGRKEIAMFDYIDQLS